MTDDIKVIFIIPKDCRDQNDCSEEMLQAFTACQQHRGGGLEARWVPETQWTQFEGLTKRYVFVLPEFNGELYDRLRHTKCLLVGPRCLSCCLTEGTPIPSGPEPVFTVAMRGIVVTASGLSKQQKENIKRKVYWMGGIYSTVLTDETTHLVSDTVLSDKYLKSIQKGIPVMNESWVEAVWEASLQLNINGQSPEFNSHRLQAFHNLQVTTSGISKKEKQAIMKLINENGGQFSGAFQSETTDVVVLNKEGIGSEKYKAALEYGKACVLAGWVRASAAAGAALPPAAYCPPAAATSSPLTNQSRLPDMSLNFSRITNLRPPSNFVDETRATDISTASGRMKMSQDVKKNSDSEIDREVQMEIESLDMSRIKKIGPIFDGYCIWVCGVGNVADRISVCISRLCGVRYSSPHARVTHVLAGNSTAAREAGNALPTVPVLKLAWLVDSVRKGEVQNETEYLYDIKPSTPSKSAQKSVEAASPMSKRNLQLLRRPSPLRLPPPEPEAKADDEIINHYLSQQVPEPEVKIPETSNRRADHTDLRIEQPDITEDMTDEPTEEIEQIFRGIKIEVCGLDEEAVCELGAEVGAAGGALVAAGAGGSHVLVPIDYTQEEIGNQDAEPVTVFWIKDCLSQQQLVPIEYYHRPVRVSDGTTLRGVVASLSTYSGVQRAFLDELAKLLGATTQLRFCRRNTANALASTHLICPTPTGDKYIGAVKWGLPAVRHTWLLECAEKGVRVSERDHLVGETTVPSLPPQAETDENEARQTDEQDKQIGKENEMLPPPGTSVPRRGSTTAQDTPKQKQNVESADDMSPASRYIAMARQGLLMDSQETPKKLKELIAASKQETERHVRTPPLDDALSTPNLMGLSPTTRRRIQAVKRGEMPSDPIRTPVDPFEKQQETPDSAFGAALRPGTGRLSPDARKRLWKVVQDLPSKENQPAKDKTPLSEIRNRFLAQFNNDAPTPASEHHSAPRKLLLQEQEETPPTKMAKTFANQSAGTSLSESRNKASTVRSANTPSAAGTGTSTASAASPHSAASAHSASTLPAAVDAQLHRLSAASAHSASTLPAAVDAQLHRLSAASAHSASTLPAAVDAQLHRLSAASAHSASTLPAAVDAQLHRLSAASAHSASTLPAAVDAQLHRLSAASAHSASTLPAAVDAQLHRLSAASAHSASTLPAAVDAQLHRLSAASAHSASTLPAAVDAQLHRLSAASAHSASTLPAAVDAQLHRLSAASAHSASTLPAAVDAQLHRLSAASAHSASTLPAAVDAQLHRLSAASAHSASTLPAAVDAQLHRLSAASAHSASTLPAAVDAQLHRLSAASAHSASTLPAAVDAQLHRLSAALSARGTPQRAKRARDSVSIPAVESEPGPESQPNTVGWDDSTPASPGGKTPPSTVKRFMLSSNVDNREEIIVMIEHLGGVVSECAEMDPEATHLLCAAPGRSEKMLGSVAAGRWVLHPAYITNSRAAGTFLDEEDFEWGNPRATCLPPLSASERALARAAHRWRGARPGAFAGVVALLHVPVARRRLLARLITAGDGLAPDDEPPYTNEDINVCFADIKRYPISDRDKAWLRARRVPVCAPILLSSYLTDDPQPDPEVHCLPEFRYKEFN